MKCRFVRYVPVRKMKHKSKLTGQECEISASCICRRTMLNYCHKHPERQECWFYTIRDFHLASNTSPPNTPCNIISLRNPPPRLSSITLFHLPQSRFRPLPHIKFRVLLKHLQFLKKPKLLERICARCAGLPIAMVIQPSEIGDQPAER
jgi:hypothetical protein